jgi:site-specific DNA-cytosine methylase
VAPTMNGFELEGSDIRATTIVADPVSANEGRTYTHEGKNNFRTHNVVVDGGAKIVNVEHGLAAHGSMDVSSVSPSVTKSEHKGHSVVIDGADPFSFKASHFTRGKDGEPSAIMPPLSADADKGDQDAVIFQPATAVGIPRRLMPLECERLQGWADYWTDIPKKTILNRSDAAAAGVVGEIEYDFPSDAKRYRAVGNGVAKPVAQWIAWRIRLAAAEAYLTLSSQQESHE